MEGAQTLKIFKFTVSIVFAALVLFLVLTYRPAGKVTIEDDLSEEVTSSELELVTSFYIDEVETTSSWVLDDMYIQELGTMDVMDVVGVSVEGVGKERVYKSNISWTKGYLTQEEFWSLCVVAGRLYRDSINPEYSVYVQYPSDTEMGKYESAYLYNITEDYELVVRVHLTLKDNDEIVEEGIYELTLIYNVDHIVLK